jgi:phospholipase, patatin family
MERKKWIKILLCLLVFNNFLLAESFSENSENLCGDGCSDRLIVVSETDKKNSKENSKQESIDEKDSKDTKVKGEDKKSKKVSKNKKDSLETDKKSEEKFVVNNEIDTVPEIDKKIGIAFGGGSAKGLAHIGILKVLEEEKVPIEYVTGTSMGSIIGGLYAAGYTAKELEDIAVHMDWMGLFNDKIDREKKGIVRNMIEDRNTLSLPMEKFMPKITPGAIGGKSASERLNELLYGVLDKNDFTKYPKKFAAVGTDLNTGEGVMITKGSLATAIRSSLSLPSIYNPMQVGDKLYIDGGVVRNLPVQDLKVLGADYTIGINVGSGFEKRDLNKMTLVDVVSDAMTIAGRQEVERQIRMLDMYMAPDLSKVEAYDFLKAKDIIAMGEKLARDHIDEIRKLSNPKKFDEIEEKRKEFRKTWKNEYDIKSVEIRGNKKYETEYFKRYLPEKLGKMNEKELESIVDNLYKNGDFSTVYYEIADGDKLVINVQEKAGDYLTFSSNANTEDLATITVGIQGNKTLVGTLDTRYQLKGIIADEYGINGAGTVLFGKSNKLLGVTDFEYKRDKIKNQYFMNEKYDFENQKFRAGLGLGVELNTNTLFLIGGGYQISDVNKSLDKNMNKKTKFPYFETSLTHDSRDAINFATKGSYFKADYIKGSSKEAKFDTLYVKGEVNIPFGKKVTVTPSITYVTTDGDKVPETYRPKLGGFSESDYSMEFGGIPVDKLSGSSIFIGKLNLQYQINKFIFAGINGSIARISDKGFDFGKEQKENYGLGVGARLPIGPIYFGLAKSPGEGVRYIFNIGYEPKAFNEN